MRLIAAKRVSRLKDGSTSAGTQDTGMQEYADRHGHTIVLSTSDLDVSGGVPIRQRPDVGPLLTPEHLDKWDGLAGYRLDRLFRNHYDFVTFYHDFCEPHGKVIISTGEGIDTTTRMGRFMAGQLVQFAEWELERMRERRKDARDRLVTAAHWNGGVVPFDYMAVKAGEHFDLVPHPENAEITREMARWIISGRSGNALARHLRERGITTGQGKPWRTQQIGPFLRSPRRRGYVVEGPRSAPRLVLGGDGMPVRRTPVLDDETWFALQGVLDRNAERKSAVHTRASALLGVAFCALCGRKLYADVREARTRAYYVCPGRLDNECAARSVPMDGLEVLAACLFVGRVGHVEVIERVIVPNDTRAKELAEVGQAIVNLNAERYQHGVMRPGFEEIRADLEAQHARLLALPPEPDVATERPTGQTIGQLWDDAGIEARRQLMIKAGFQVRIAKIKKDTPVPRSQRKRVIGELMNHLASVLLVAGVTGIPEEAGEYLRTLADPNSNLVIALKVGPDLERRARLVASGQSVPLPDQTGFWDRVLAPVRESMGKPRLAAVEDPA